MITWNDTLATGHPVVDQDHRKLIDGLNALETALREGAGKERIRDMLVFLDSYAKAHFAREEAHMQRVRCPAHAANCQAHREFVERLDKWIGQYQAGATTTLVLEIHREISAWIRSHILKIDCTLKSCPSA